VERCHDGGVLFHHEERCVGGCGPEQRGNQWLSLDGSIRSNMRIDGSVESSKPTLLLRDSHRRKALN
jgi:hypothetical protein